jgi:glycosyltransferase involved in cell wall biosynthesis
LTKRPRFFYALGPGDVVDSYQKWSAGSEYTSETQLTLSGQFFDFCRAHGAEAYAISSHPSRALVREGSFIVENRPKPFANPRGLTYHLGQVWYGLSVLGSALRFGADVMIVDSGTTHWFVLKVLSLTRVRVVPCLHNVYWPAGYPPAGAVKRTILMLDGWFWRTRADATLCVSPECQRQVELIARGRNRAVFQFRGQYLPHVFASAPPPPPHESRPFRTVYVGRVQREKGVFDLLDIAERLERELPGQLQYEICGGGSDLEELKQTIAQRGLTAIVHALGRVSRDDLVAAYGRAHVVIVPTRSSFCEGMTGVASEAILTGRPVLTSRLSNVIDVFEEAIVEAQPDNLESYVDGLRRLLTDRTLYEKCCQACPSLRQQFYDRSCGWGAAMERAVRSFDPNLLPPVVVEQA